MREDDEQPAPADPVDLLAAWQTNRESPGSGRRVRPAAREPRPEAPREPGPGASYEPEVGALDAVWRPPDTGEIDELWPADHPTAVEELSTTGPATGPTTGSTTGSTTDIVFQPRLWGHRLMSLILVLVGIGAALACVVAVQEPTTDRVGIAGALVVLTLAVWGIRASAPVTRLALRSGQLELRRGGRHQVFELHSVRTPVRLEGTPGRRGWRVRIGMPGESPWVVDDSMVDPHAFTEALLRLRPDLRPTDPADPPGRN